MKPRNALSILLFVSVSGCIPLSLHPLYTDEDLVYDPGLEGTWGEEDDRWIFEKAGENEYTLTVLSGDDDPVTLSAHLVQLKKYQFLDLQATEVSGIGDFASFMLIPAHAIWQYERDGDTFRLRTLDYDWMNDRLEKGRLWVSHEKLDDWFVFTAEPKRMQRFFLKWIDNEDAYSDWDDIKRAPEAENAPLQP